MTLAQIARMNHSRTAVVLIVLAPLACMWSPPASGQDFIGEAIGRVVIPGLGEAAKRGIGEELGERLFGRRRPPTDPGPLPSPLPYPRPNPQPQPQPQPIWRPKPPQVVNPPQIITQPYIPIEPARRHRLRQATESCGELFPPKMRRHRRSR